jgi:hypothetical protein
MISNEKDIYLTRQYVKEDMIEQVDLTHETEATNE